MIGILLKFLAIGFVFLFLVVSVVVSVAIGVELGIEAFFHRLKKGNKEK